MRAGSDATQTCHASCGPVLPHHREGTSRTRSEEHTSELQSPCNIVCRLLLEKKNKSTPSWSAASIVNTHPRGPSISSRRSLSLPRYRHAMITYNHRAHRLALTDSPPDTLPRL